MASSTFLHMVYFWLKDSGNAAHAAEIAAGCRTHLTNIPDVLRLEVGFPAGTEREVVDNSYGVALLVEFPDAVAHDVYQDHPDHLAFIAACSHLWSHVRVYDATIG